MMHYGLTEVSRAVFLDFHKGDLNSVGSTKNGTKVLIMDQDLELLKSLTLICTCLLQVEVYLG